MTELKTIKNEPKKPSYPTAFQFLETGEAYEKKEPLPWYENFVEVLETNEIIDIRTGIDHTSQQFNRKNQKYLPDDCKTTPIKYVEKKSLLQQVDKKMYLPTDKKRVTDYEGLSVLNTYDEKSRPKKSESITPEGLRAIEFIKNHFFHLCGNKKDADFLMEWVAHQVQKTGSLMGFSVVLYGVEGSGKTATGTLVGKLIGRKNIRAIGNDSISSTFNSWAVGQAVGVIEEMKLDGHSRHEIANKLKPFITNEHISIHPKNKPEYETLNTCNYICFTNYQDALPMSENDRRYFIVFSPYKSISEFEKKIGFSAKVYFKKFYAIISSPDLIGQLIKFFSEMDTPILRETGTRPPMSEGKRIMIELENEKIEGFTEVKGLISKNEVYFNNSIVQAEELKTALYESGHALKLNSKQISYILRKLGYQPHSTNVKDVLKNSMPYRRFWTKGSMTSEDIRDNLKTQSFLNS